MHYTNESVRRQDRLLNEETAISILKNGEYGVLSMQAEDAGGYGMPINYAWDEKHSIYAHCAHEGRKLRCIDKCNKVSFCVVGKTNVLPSKFSTEYESIVLHCTAHRNLPTDERMKALVLLLEKYSPNDMEKGKKYAENSLAKTEIIRLDVIEWSGKSRSIK